MIVWPNFLVSKTIRRSSLIKYMNLITRKTMSRPLYQMLYFLVLMCRYLTVIRMLRKIYEALKLFSLISPLNFKTGNSWQIDGGSKWSRIVGSAKGTVDKSKEPYYRCNNLGNFQKECPNNKTFTPSYPFKASHSIHSLNQSYKGSDNPGKYYRSL